MRTLLAVLAIALAAWTPAVLAAPFGKPMTSTGEIDFRLQAGDGKEVRLADFRGRVVAVVFGYTQCPDYCPTTLARLARATRALRKPERFQPVFVTLDPERDTPGVIAAYVQAFHPALLALRGDPAQTRELAARFRVLYEKVEEPGGSYSIDHGGGIFLLDASGRLRLKELDNLGADEIARDIELLQQED